MKSTFGPRRMHGDAVNAVADLGILVGNVLRRRPRLIGCQVFAAVVGPKRARRGDGDEHPVVVGRIDEDGVQAQPAGARLPLRARAVAAQARRARATTARRRSTGTARRLRRRRNRVGIGQRRLEVPDALEFPGVRRAVVPLMRAGDAVVDELVADRLPGLAAVVERWITWPNQPLDWEAYSRSGSTGEPLR